MAERKEGIDWGNPISAGIDFVGGMFSGDEEYQPQEIHSRWTDPYQGMLFQDQMKRARSGAGDFGFGQAAKAGTGTLQQMMADRGISQDSGVATAATGSMLGDAMSRDIANRRAYTQNLMAMTPQKERSEAGFKNNDWYGRNDAERSLGYRSGGSPEQQRSEAYKYEQRMKDMI